MIHAYSEVATKLGEDVKAWARVGSEVPAVSPLASMPLARVDVMLAIAYGYLLFVGMGSYIMSREGRQPVKLPVLQRLYNVIQVVLCGYMTVAAAVTAYTSSYTLWPCNAFDGASPPMGFLLWLFYMSKALDFVDTVFMILGQKWAQRSFLHVYHHWSIFQFYWLNVHTNYDGDIYLTIVLNAGIHTIMYSYYFCSTQQAGALKAFTRVVRPYITSMQLLQFFTMLTQAVLLLGRGCTTPSRNVTKLYFAYICTMVVLFGHFFVTSYVRKPKRSAGEGKKAS